MMLRARSQPAKRRGSLRGHPWRFKPVSAQPSRAKRRATSRRLLEVALATRLGGERREERRCETEQSPAVGTFRDKPRGRGGSLLSPGRRLGSPHLLGPELLDVSKSFCTKSLNTT